MFRCFSCPNRLFQLILLCICAIAPKLVGAETGHANLVGHEVCGQCHESELAIWLKSPHTTTYQMIANERDRRFNPKTKKILANLQGNYEQKCAKCHDTRTIQNGHAVSLKGISCESCHGAAGSTGHDDGWLHMHHELDRSNRGPIGSVKEQEKQHVALLEQKGMRHSKNIYALVKACFECHTVSVEEVVKAGHPTGRIGFEYISWFREDLQHPSELTIDSPDAGNSKSQTCVKFLVGQLVDLEVSLTNRANAESRGYAISAATRIASTKDTLMRIQQVEPLHEIAVVMDELSRVSPVLFRTGTSGNDIFKNSAARVSNVAQGFVRKNENLNLSAIEDFLPKLPAPYNQPESGDSFRDQLALLDHMNSQCAPDPSKVKGNAACARCHQSEYDAWSRSAHAQEAFDELRTNPNSYKYARRLGIDANEIARDSVCVTCHATKRMDHNGTLSVLAGISCESCHNGAGGENGWLNSHTVIETSGIHAEHHSIGSRIGKHDSNYRGMNRASDIYELAKKCYQCHLVSNERVVALGGHKVGRFDFEWVEWSQGEVRHNFQVNQRKNSLAPAYWIDAFIRHGGGATLAAERKRVMFVIGQLVDIEISLRNRATANSLEFSRAAAGRIAAANARLVQIQDASSSIAMGKLLREIEALIPRLFSPPRNQHDSELLSLADRVAKIAKQFAVTCDPVELKKVDVLLPRSGIGKVYQP